MIRKEFSEAVIFREESAGRERENEALSESHQVQTLRVKHGRHIQGPARRTHGWEPVGDEVGGLAGTKVFWKPLDGFQQESDKRIWLLCGE